MKIHTGMSVNSENTNWDEVVHVNMYVCPGCVCVVGLCVYMVYTFVYI